jgi:hypothetical protein
MKPRKPFCLSVAALAAVAFAAPLTVAASQVQRAQVLGALQMPAGDQVEPASLSVFDLQEIRTLIPMPDDQLAAAKELSAKGLAGSAGADPVAVRVKTGVSRSAADGAFAESGGAAPTPLYASTACNTNIATGFAPSDIHGAAGPGVLVVVTNVDIGVYNKSTCAVISRVPLKTLFAGAFDIANQTLFDPKVLYDTAAGRFFVTAESRDNRGITDQYQYFAVSTTNAATAWNRYQLTLSRGSSLFCKRASNSFWDYPSSGKSANRWFITANDFPATGGATGAILMIDKAPTLTGAAVSAKCFNNLQFNIAPPIVLDSLTSQSVFIYPRSTFIGRYNHAAGTTVGADTLAAGVSYPIAAWAIPPDAVQPNGQKLDSLDGRFQSASIQSRDRIWNIHTVASGTAPVIRWYRMTRAASTVLSTNTFASGHLFNPSFVTGSGIDGAPAFINASRTVPTCATSTCLASMLTFSGPNTNTVGWLASLAGSSTNQFLTTNGATLCNNDVRGSCRWGDYSSITVDPNEAGSAWGFNQLINGTNQFNWFTRGRKEIYNLQN